MKGSAILVLAISASAMGAKTPAVSYGSFKAGKAYYHTVTCDLASGALAVKTMHSSNLTSVWSFIAREQPVVALTGTFFNLKSHRPVADVLVDGRLVAQGSRGTAVGIDWLGGVEIFDRPYRVAVDWTNYQFGLRGAIRVVNGGVVQPNPKAQRFRDSGLWGRASRTGLGLTENGKLVVFATKNSVTLSELGKAMKTRGIRNGVALDGGTSSCLYYNGAMLVSPGRKLCNMLVITRRNADGLAALGL